MGGWFGRGRTWATRAVERADQAMAMVHCDEDADAEGARDEWVSATESQCPLRERARRLGGRCGAGRANWSV